MMHGVFALSVTGRNANLRSNDPRESVMPRASARSLPQLSVRIDLDSEGRIGPGKIELLEQIREHGSISAAGRSVRPDRGLGHRLRQRLAQIGA